MFDTILMIVAWIVGVVVVGGVALWFFGNSDWMNRGS